MSKLFRLLKNSKGPVLLGITIVLATIFVILFSSRLLYIRTVDLLTVNLRERIQAISTTAAATLSYQDIEALHKEEDWLKPEWAYVVNKLHRIKYTNKDIVFMYIFRKNAQDPTKMEFVADADSIDPYANSGSDISKYVDVNRDGKVEPEGPDKLQWPGQPYPEAADIPETFIAYERPITSKDIYSDEYGSVITGYSPIKNDNGETVAVLAVDMKADDFLKITTQTLQPFVIFIVFLTLTISILTIILMFSWRRYAHFLEESNKEKSEFISFASHQIRTPLTSIRGFSSNLLEGDYGSLPPQVREIILKILVRSQEVVSLIGQYLDKSKMELGQLDYDFKPFDITSLTQQIVNEFTPAAQQQGIELRFDQSKTPDCVVKGDQGKIKELLSNLLDNSIKYTPSGYVEVTIEKKDQKALVYIKDTGVGMSTDTIKGLFQKFGRGKDAAKTNILGTGLGLYLAQIFAVAHKGKVIAQSEGEGKGSTFITELPLA